MKTLDFHSAMFQANLLYGLELQETDFEEIGLIAWNFIGNKDVKTYTLNLLVDQTTHTVTLPCNVLEIEAVTYGYEDWNYTSNKYEIGDITSQFTENFIEGSKRNKNPLYISGKFAKYEQVGNTLYFDNNTYSVNILYKGIHLDENGLPYLTDKESIAIATYCAYVKAAKEYYMTMNQQVLQKMQLLQMQWQKYCDAARVGYINQNKMNEILDAKSSWNRKIFNKTYKPFK